jgi:hypothetical protein
MKSLDYTLELLPGSQIELQNATLPLSNPKPILQQTKSIITTNPFIVPTENEGSKLTYTDTSKGVSKSFIGLLDDLLNKPDDTNWYDYLKMILTKDNRLNYLTVLLFFIALYILLIK